MRYKDIQIAEVWEDIRHYRPLVYQLTNMVAANFQANISLAAGASPLMSINAEEASFLASRADSILINTGTPSDESIRSIKEILPVIRKEKKPLVLDPVGYGASPLRISLVEEILRSEAVTTVKGNRGEMGLLGGEEGTVQGV
ncbi:MAG: hydroxyethylthiazole kinase, partial [Aminobacterium colombiense]|nr:hydroxyethylthiazole kinase [Aminobacterium colombiense]